MMNSEPQPTRGENQLTIAVKEEQISTAPGNGVNLLVGILNGGTEAEDVEISVKGVPESWITTPIETRLLHIPAGQAGKVMLTILPPPLPESRVGLYPLVIQAVGNDPYHPAVAHTLLTLAAYESRGRIGILLGTTQFSAIPGSTVHIPILLLNRGLQEDDFRLGVTGIPANWISTESPITRLGSGESRELMLTIHVPRSPQAGAGRTPFAIQLTSQMFPDEIAEVSCILTIAAFSQFLASLEPETLMAGQSGRVIVINEGNTVDTFSLNFQSTDDLLTFQKPVQVTRPGAQQVESGYAQIPPGDRFQVEAGQSVAYPFRALLKTRPLVGGEASYPFTFIVTSAERRQDLPGRLIERALLPLWLPVLMAVGAFGFCLLFLFFSFRNFPSTATATQTAAVNQTQAALAGGVDTDGDGLSDAEEQQRGTNPAVADTDGDGLSDGEEVKTVLTDPLLPDTDADGLSDGQEVQQFKTDPRNPDTDGDLLNDGSEIEHNTDPKVQDSDQDGLGDGAEVTLGTDPRQPDSDRDGLLDGQENQNCPRPLTPDSDGDGIIDGTDRDPCNPSNPSLTAAAPTQPLPTQPLPTQPLPTQPLPTQPLPTLPLPTAVIPTLTPVPVNTTVPPTSLAASVFTSAPPNLQGLMLFSSNRDGNSEIYALDLANQSLNRLTTNTTEDVQPALAPDGIRIAYVSNQDGNNEIYLGGTDRRLPVNITGNPADDQQPAWSPDGNWIAFTSNRDGNQEIYVMRSDGSQLRNLTNSPANDSAPTWYSVGGLFGFGTEDWIAFTSTRDGNQEIYRVRPNGTGLTNLTNNPAQDYAPSAYPGGLTLAFVSERDGNPEIYTMNQTGGSVTRITTNPTQDLEPAISSNGWILFSTDRDGNFEVYAVPMQGGTVHNLTHSPGQDRDPDW